MRVFRQVVGCRWCGAGRIADGNRAAAALTSTRGL